MIQSSNISNISANSNNNQSCSWTPQTLLSSSYKDLGSPSTVKARFLQHLLSSQTCLASLLQILFIEIGKTGIHDYSIPIDMHDFLRHDPVLGNMLLRYPGTLLSLLEEAIVEAQKEILQRIDSFYHLYNQDAGNDNDNEIDNDTTNNNNNNNNINTHKSAATVKGDPSTTNTRVHARLVHLPPHSSNVKPSLSALASSDVGKILQLSGTVTRASTIQMYESQRAYRCSEKSGCGSTFVVKADLHQRNNALVDPVRCPTAGCKSKSFQVIQEDGFGGSGGGSGNGNGAGNALNRSDYQEIKVQESISSASNSRTGAIPRALLIKLQHDLVDACQPGDDVVIVGTLMSHWGQLVNMGDVDIGMAMHAHSVRVMHGSGSGNGSGSGSSWDCIFDGDQKNLRGGDASGSADGSSSSKTVGGMGMGMVREEIVKEFASFWEEPENKKRPIAARNFICQAVCPTLYGVSLVKLALLITLIGGSGAAASTRDARNSAGQRDGIFPAHVADLENEDGDEDVHAPVQFSLFDDNETTPSSHKSSSSPHHRNQRQYNMKRNTRSNEAVQTRRREQSHLLLVGDPGCGKSQFLRFAAALCPRSVLTSGSGTTSAGLTCAAVRDDSSKEYTLEAGALVLADRGVCAIDEFSCIKPADRTTIHEAMEQQTLSVAKAGIVCKLNCRATVVAVTNAKGGIYDHDKSFTVNVGIEPPLLSRFDLIFKLIDGSDAAKDDNVATFLLNRAIQGAGYDCAATGNSAKSGKQRSPWNIDKLRAYIATVKSCFHPTISSDASLLLERHYSACRSSEYIEIQVTVRLLESLIRLSQAHARLMHRNVVELDDAVAIILLMECTVASTSSNTFNSLYTDPAIAVFPDDDKADIEFLLDKRKVLEKYQMLELLTPDEVSNIEKDHHNVTSTVMEFEEGHRVDDNGWENYNAGADHSSLHHDPAPLSSDVPAPNVIDCYTPAGQKKRRGWRADRAGAAHNGTMTTQDHYGRFSTQKATPSPSSRIQPTVWVGDNYSVGPQQGHTGSTIESPEHSNGRATKRRRNHSAD